MRVELPEGQWAEIKDPEQLRRKDEKAVLRASSFSVDPVAGTGIIGGSNDQDMEDAMLARVITQWSFPLPLPCADPESLDQLSLDQAPTLAKAVKPHLELISTVVDPTKKDSDPTAG